MKFSKYFQARIKQDFNYPFLTKQESSKISKIFLHTKQESSKTKVAREGSIKIETRVLTPKSSRSRFSSKSCSSLQTNYIFLCSPKSVAMTPTDVSKIVFNPLITLHLIPDTGVMTAIGVRKFGCGKLPFKCS